MGGRRKEDTGDEHWNVITILYMIVVVAVGVLTRKSLNDKGKTINRVRFSFSDFPHSHPPTQRNGHHNIIPLPIEL